MRGTLVSDKTGLSLYTLKESLIKHLQFDLHTLRNNMYEYVYGALKLMNTSDTKTY